MTINIEELKRDREAGAGGPWKWIDQDGYYTLSPGIFISDSTDVTPWGDNIDTVNARRIARLPDLEAAFLEAVEALENVRDYADIAGVRVAREFLDKIT